jgi:hypothetical protein
MQVRSSSFGPAVWLLSLLLFFSCCVNRVSAQTIISVEGLGIGIGSFQRITSNIAKDLYVNGTRVEWRTASGHETNLIQAATFFPSQNSFCCWTKSNIRLDKRYQIPGYQVIENPEYEAQNAVSNVTSVPYAT